MPDQEDCVIFFGRVHPERANVNIYGLPPMQIGFSPGELVDASVRVDASQVTVSLSGILHRDPATERNVIGYVSQLLVDVLGFTNGCGYTVEIVGSSRKGGTTIFGCDIPALSADPPAEPATFESIVSLLVSDPEGNRWPLRRALGDFRRAILEPDDTPFHCYRAVESLTFYFDTERSRGWKALRTALGLDEVWIKSELKKPADLIRHGHVVKLTGEDRLRAFRASRTVITRFVALLHSGLDSLPQSEYPPIRGSWATSSASPRAAGNRGDTPTVPPGG